MSQEEINKRVAQKLIKKIRTLPDQEILNLYNDAIAFRIAKQVDLQKLLQTSQAEVMNELRKKKLKMMKEQAKRDDDVSVSEEVKINVEPETPEE